MSLYDRVSCSFIISSFICTTEQHADGGLMPAVTEQLLMLAENFCKSSLYNSPSPYCSTGSIRLINVDERGLSRLHAKSATSSSFWLQGMNESSDPNADVNAAESKLYSSQRSAVTYQP